MLANQLEARRPQGYTSLSRLRRYQENPLRFLVETAREQGRVAITFQFANARFFLVSDPEAAQRVLITNASNYRKPDRYKVLKAVLGEGLLTNEGESWRRQRRAVQPIFHRERIAGFASQMASSTHTMLEGWRAHEGRPLDVAAEMMKLSLRVAGLTLFSVDLLGEADALGAAITTAIEHANRAFKSVFTLPEFIPTPENLRFRAAMRRLDRVVQEMITERRGDGVDRGDLLSMLLATRDAESGEGMSDTQLRDEVMTMLLAGHETTANALSWTFYLLSKHPEAERRLRAEALEVLGEGAPTPQHLPRLAYTTRVIQESMRLYPPAWSFGRQALADDELGGRRIPRGSTVVLAPYVIHRDAAHWENPEGFDPDRFLPERAKGRHKLAYLPFAAGTRKCVGTEFAMMELGLIVPMVVRACSLHLLPGAEVKPEASVTLRPKEGLPMIPKALR